MTTLDLTKPIQTRSGLPVRILFIDQKSNYPIVGLYLNEGEKYINTWTLGGKLLAESTCACPLDLVNVPEPAVPHVHAELIKRWADNQNLLVEYLDKYMGEWIAIKCPDWDPDVKYRIVD